MCVVCKDWEKGKLTNKEALDAIGELASTSDDKIQTEHYLDVADKIMDKEVPLADADAELDRSWHEENYDD